MTEEIINLGLREKTERQFGGPFNVTGMEEKSRLKCSTADLRITGIVYENAKIRARDSKVVIDYEADFSGSIRVTDGSVIIDSVIAPEAQISADTILVSPRAKLLPSVDIAAGELRLQSGFSTHSGLKLTDTVENLIIESGCTVNAGDESSITQLAAFKTITVLGNMNFVFNESCRHICISSDKILAEQVTFPKVELYATGGIDAAAFDGTKIRMFNASGLSFIYAGSANKADIQFKDGEVVITQIRDSKLVANNTSVESHLISGGSIEGATRVEAGKIINKAKISAQDVKAEDIGFGAEIYANNVESTTIGSEASVRALGYVKADNIGAAMIKAGGKVMAFAIGPGAEISAGTVIAHKISNSATIDAREIILLGSDGNPQHTYSGKWPPQFDVHETVSLFKKANEVSKKIKTILSSNGVDFSSGYVSIAANSCFAGKEELVVFLYNNCTLLESSNARVNLPLDKLANKLMAVFNNANNVVEYISQVTRDMSDGFKVADALRYLTRDMIDIADRAKETKELANLIKSVTSR